MIGHLDLEKGFGRGQQQVLYLVNKSQSSNINNIEVSQIMNTFKTLYSNLYE